MAERPPVTASRLAWAAPEAVARRLSGQPDFVWLDSERSASRFARWSYMAALPVSMLCVTRAGASVDGRRSGSPALEVMRRAFAAKQPVDPGLPPFAGGFIGYMTYEFGELTMPWRSPHLEPEAGSSSLSEHDPFRKPASTFRDHALVGDNEILAEFGCYTAVLAWDHHEKTCTLVARDGGGDERYEEAAEALAAAHADAMRDGAAERNPGWSMADLRWKAAQEREDFVAAIARTRDYIAAGDIYQANLAQCFTTELSEGATPFEHYLMLRRANPAPFAAYLEFLGRTIGSTSPERFLAVNASGAVEARPIKGTIRIGATEALDREAVRQLTTSEKERAENVMIVDLLRNDLSRVCKPHTVKTPDICVVETYEGLHHLVSSVTGQLKDGRQALDAVLAAFPGGSITGAPKLRAMEIIGQLEPQARGVFCGSIGYVGFDGTTDFNIAIRTVEYNGKSARLLAGGGVTYLSDPSAEYEETLLKAERVLGSAPS